MDNDRQLDACTKRKSYTRGRGLRDRVGEAITAEQPRGDAGHPRGIRGLNAVNNVNYCTASRPIQ